MTSASDPPPAESPPLERRGDRPVPVPAGVGFAAAVRERLTAWRRRPLRLAPYAAVLLLGMLLWGRLLLKEPPRVASAGDEPAAAAAAPAAPATPEKGVRERPSSAGSDAPVSDEFSARQRGAAKSLPQTADAEPQVPGGR